MPAFNISKCFLPFSSSVHFRHLRSFSVIVFKPWSLVPVFSYHNQLAPWLSSRRTEEPSLWPGPTSVLGDAHRLSQLHSSRRDSLWCGLQLVALNLLSTFLWIGLTETCFGQNFFNFSSLVRCEQQQANRFVPLWEATLSNLSAEWNDSGDRCSWNKYLEVWLLWGSTTLGLQSGISVLLKFIN